MACYKARGFLQKAESLGLTALGLGQRMFGLRLATKHSQSRVRTLGASKLARLFLRRHTTFGFTSAPTPAACGVVVDCPRDAG
jgi:hypothetical protein